VRLRLPAALTILVLARIAASTQDPAITGSWRGTSLCVDKEHFPACKNEQVIYDARAKGTSRDTVTIRADKVVNGVREFMGEFDYHRAADSSWVADYQNPRVHIQIVLRVRATHLTGTLTDIPSGRRVRDIALERITPP
jgi:hypothetical protein